ncbi:hypothetical protein [Bacillus subtilis]|uniref:hypothetical protein n=1 Tax=Bacillus subtilis TaxID=1423 RepID=UPI003D7F586C
MAETNANASASIHVLADETLGGMKREYVEVDRKAEVGEKIIIVDADAQSEEPYYDGNIFNVKELLAHSPAVRTKCGRFIFDSEYRVLEPTDIVHIGTQRYELTDRKAEVGEKIIHLYEGESDGIAREVRKVDATSVEVDPFVHNGGVRSGFAHGYYRVLVPVESAEADEPQPSDPIFAIGNVAQEVAKLKRIVERLENEIDTLHKDNRTLGEELERLKEPKDNESWPAAVSFADFCEGFIAYSKAMREAQK